MLVKVMINLKKKYGLSKNNIFAVCMISKYWSPVYSLIRHYTNFSIDDYIKEQNDFWFKKRTAFN